MAQVLARRIAKCVFFILLSLVVGRSIGCAETYISQDFADKIAVFISGESNIETLYDAYFYIDFSIVISITTAVYLTIAKLIKKQGASKMPLPPYMWLKDGGGADIQGSVDVQDREGSIEIIGMSHGINLSVDGSNGRITGTRQHSSMMIEKEVDSSTPYLYKAAATGQTLKSAELRFYNISNAGQEVCYYTVLMENVKVTGVNCGVANVKLTGNDKLNHTESVSLQYEKITWRIVDGNIQYADAWNERPTA